MRLTTKKTMITPFIAASALSLAPAVQARPVIEIKIENRGTMSAELFSQEAPKTVARFLELVRSNFYDGTRFHRVENYPRPFLIQAGDPFSKTLSLDDPKVGTGGSGTKIPFEKNDIPFLNGTMGLVRDQKDPNSGDSQFFICNGNQRFLDGTYVAFGRVIDGLAVIPQVKRGDRIISIRIVKK